MNKRKYLSDDYNLKYNIDEFIKSFPDEYFTAPFVVKLFKFQPKMHLFNILGEVVAAKQENNKPIRIKYIIKNIKRLQDLGFITIKDNVHLELNKNFKPDFDNFPWKSNKKVHIINKKGGAFINKS